MKLWPIIFVVNWTDLTGIKLPFDYKIQSLETEDLDTLFAFYVSLYLDLPITRIRIARAEAIKRYASVIIGSGHFSSKLEFYSLCSAWIYASLATTNEGALNLGIPFCWLCSLFLFPFNKVEREVCESPLCTYLMAQAWLRSGSMWKSYHNLGT